jgi:hypothetical protein
MTMAVMTVERVLSSWRLQEQKLDGTMRAGGGRCGCGDNGSGSVVARGVGGGRHNKRRVDNARLYCWYRDDDDNRWDLPPPHAARIKAADAAMLPLARPL